jgi:UDP-glucose 4-epimerase
MTVLLIGHGYVGSFLRPALQQAGFDVAVCDQNLSRLAGLPDAIHNRYQGLTIGDLGGFEAILWFAGHSSVPLSVQDPDGAIANNCFDLMQLAKRKRVGTRLIYASTASVYSISQRGPLHIPPAVDEDETRLNPLNPYDVSKIAFDALAACFTSEVTGLRLGTVSGHGPALRRELVFNAMNLSALEKGRVTVANRYAHRNILFLDDLAHYVVRLLRTPGSLPRILNAGSYNLTFGELANEIAEHYGVPVEEGPDSKTYSFRMSARRIDDLCGAPQRRTIASRCAQFASAVEIPLKAMAS